MSILDDNFMDIREKDIEAAAKQMKIAHSLCKKYLKMSQTRGAIDFWFRVHTTDGYRPFVMPIELPNRTSNRSISLSNIQKAAEIIMEIRLRVQKETSDNRAWLDKYLYTHE